MLGTRRGLLAGTCLTLLGLTAMPAELLAQAAEKAGGLEEIVVTARRREEALQDTPVSVSALSTAALERSNVQQLDKLTQLVPNVAMTATPGFMGANTAFIRGIGSQEPSLSLDTAVGTYLDGIYLGRNTASNFDLVALERVEVLRGPQGTLFGRNTTGGAINLITKAPARDFGIEEKAGFASFGEWSSRTTVDTGELGGTGLSATVAYLHRKRDGYVDNPFAPDSKDPGSLLSNAVWAKLHGEWGAVKADYSFDYDRMKGVAPAFQLGYVTPAVAGYFANATNGSRFTYSPGYLDTVPLRPLQQRVTIKGHALTLQADLTPELTVKSISGYRRFDAGLTTSYGPPGVFGPVLGSATPQEVYVYQADAKTEFARQYSQELQLLGTFERLNFVSGLYYFNEHTAETNPSSLAFVLSPTSAAFTRSLSQYAVRSRSYAAFGQASYTPPILDDRLEVTAGLRYTKDKKSAFQTAAIARQGRSSWHNTSYNVTLAYKWTPDVMTYARYGTGYRSGGFNVRATAAGQSFTFPPEKAKAAEIGFKTEFLDRRVRLNGALFHTKYDDLQVTIYTNTAGGAATGFTNPARATFKGFEAELEAVPVDGLTLGASVGYVDAGYKSIYFPAPGTGVLTNYASISHFVYVPKWTTHVGAQYDFPETGVGRFSVRGDWSTMSKRWFHVNNLPTLNPFNDQIASGGWGQVDARVTLSDIPVHFGGRSEAEASFYVENLTNEHYRVSGIDFGSLGFAGNVYSMPRRFGVDLKLAY
jgi:iron complex outermembrane receptor protein